MVYKTGHGKNTLCDFVKTMCEEAGVQGRKTNHSARKTTVTALAHNKVPPTQIMQVSGHKNVQSINKYCSASLDQQQEMSHILSDVGSGGISKQLQQKKIWMRIIMLMKCRLMMISNCYQLHKKQN